MPRSGPISAAGGVRLLVVNPNTNPAVTALIARAARAAAGPWTQLVFANPDRGPAAIETPADRRAATPHVLRLLDAHREEGFDGYIFACFDDIAVPEARARTGMPVLDLCEAGMRAALAREERFAVVTTVATAVPGIERLAARYGAAAHCTVRAAGVGVGAAADLPAEVEAKLLDTMTRAIAEDGARAILLGSGALAGQAGRFAARLDVPVIDGVAAAVAQVEAMAAVH
jgi:allantoin racemase